MPNLETVATAAFLHDIGKLYQRKIGAASNLPDALNAERDRFLPVFRGGRHGFLHVLFSLHFLDETRSLTLPKSLDRDALRTLVGHHHTPRRAHEMLRSAAMMVATADRLSAGMDRKRRDQTVELDYKGWERFRRVPQAWLLDRVDVGLGRPPSVHYSLPAILDAPRLCPEPRPGDPASKDVANRYAAVGDAFMKGFEKLCRMHADSPGLFHEGLIALSHDHLWSVPSSTMDEPDVPLHDHALAAAAFGACLYRHHEAAGDGDQPRRIADRRIKKFHLLQGELVGIQRTLTRLRSEQVKGVNRILRARSFLMQMIVDAAVLRILERFDLPPYVVLMRAGGKFVILLPHLGEGEVEGKVEEVRAEADRWMAETYQGDLALALGLTQALPGSAFAKNRVVATLDAARRAARAAKQQVLARVAAAPVLANVHYPEGPEGSCATCGVRPATQGEGRCLACAEEHRVGRLLPRARTFVWTRGRTRERAGQPRSWAPFGFKLWTLPPRAVSPPGSKAVSAFRTRDSGSGHADGPAAWPFTLRRISNHMARLTPDVAADPRFQDLSEEAAGVRPGGLLTMEHLGALAIDAETHRGIPALAVLKADVDRLGHAFALGLGGDATPGRLVTLSRLIDAFFTIRLPDLLVRRHPHTYTVFAGGDDLLLIGPWRGMIDLARDLRQSFDTYVGGNPNLTLSAGLELVGVREPLNRSLLRAEARLEAAKATGPGAARDRVSLIDAAPFEPLGWTDEATGVPWLLAMADELEARLAQADEPEAKGVPSGWLQRLLHLCDQRERAERPIGSARGARDEAEWWQAAIWRAHYRYHVARRFPDDDAMAQWFHKLMGLDRGPAEARPPTRSAISMALWRRR